MLGQITRFEPNTCNACALKPQCTTSDLGRSLRVAQNEPLQAELRARMATPEGREQLRQRVPVEHTLAHVSQRQGNRARYLGKRKNEYDLSRAATVVNLQIVQRELEGRRLANAA